MILGGFRGVWSEDFFDGRFRGEEGWWLRCSACGVDRGIGDVGFGRACSHFVMENSTSRVTEGGCRTVENELSQLRRTAGRNMRAVKEEKF